MKIALADVRRLTSLLTLLATCACGEDPTPQLPSAAGNGGNGGSSLGGGGAGGSSGAAGASGGTPSGGMASGGTPSGGTASGGTSGSSAGFGSGGAPPGSPTFTQVAAVIQASCGSKCHSGEREDLMNLSAADPGALYTRLTSPLDTDLCYKVVPVQRGSAATSLLSRVLKAEVSAPCPLPRMPAGCAESNECLAAADIALIDGWINAGAFKN